MKVKDLISRLNECDPETLVVLAADEEGNGFDYLDGFSSAEPLNGVKDKELHRLVLWLDTTQMEREHLWPTHVS